MEYKKQSGVCGSAQSNYPGNEHYQNSSIKFSDSQLRHLLFTLMVEVENIEQLSDKFIEATRIDLHQDCTWMTASLEQIKFVLKSWKSFLDREKA